MVPLLIMKTLPLKIPTSPQPRKVFSTLMSDKQQFQRLFHQPGPPKFQIITRKTNTDIMNKIVFFGYQDSFLRLAAIMLGLFKLKLDYIK